MYTVLCQCQLDGSLRPHVHPPPLYPVRVCVPQSLFMSMLEQRWTTTSDQPIARNPQANSHKNNNLGFVQVCVMKHWITSDLEMTITTHVCSPTDKHISTTKQNKQNIAGVFEETEVFLLNAHITNLPVVILVWP